jgi:penicillin-binding protein 2
MYSKRIKGFIIIMAFILGLCLLRLAVMQVVSHSFYKDRVTELKQQRNRSNQLKTIRGRILDRNGKELAIDDLKFQLCMNYKLTRFMDQRVEPMIDPDQYRQGREDLDQIIEKCSHFGVTREDIEKRIKRINTRIWNMRYYLTWRRISPTIIAFEEKYPDPNQQLQLIRRTDIAEMYWDNPVLELKTDDDIFAAQVEFLDVEGVKILPTNQRFYPYGSVAAQTIGWVGPPQEADKELFSDDRLSSYLAGELCGREDGVEYVAESILRGRRGEVVYDIDRKLIDRTETTLGHDVHLTIDIELQKRIEEHLSDRLYNRNYNEPMAAVVIDVNSGDILSLVSLPSFDLNHIRDFYARIASDSNEPLRNRAINKQYPPGSVVKPLVLIAAIEEGLIKPNEVIACQAKPAPKGWPDCLQFRRYKSCHDWKWQGQGRNIARNAIKGSCNIYFTRLADRIEPSLLQQWLFHFGYGHNAPLGPADQQSRSLRQAQGQISNKPKRSKVSSFVQIPPLRTSERRWFGMGQGNLRTTPLQVANSMALIARGGMYKPPRLFKYDSDNSPNVMVDPNISPKTIEVVYDGMYAVVNESEGSGYKAFAHNDFAGQGVRVYGKTGSTEKPANAWFAGFAIDGSGRAIAVATIVEGGQSGSGDAAPLVREMIQFCIEAGHIGNARIAYN